jgi:hypothetical protein
MRESDLEGDAAECAVGGLKTNKSGEPKVELGWSTGGICCCWPQERLRSAQALAQIRGT